MSKKSFALLLGIVFVIVGAGIFLIFNKSEKRTSSNDSASSQKSIAEESHASPKQAGRYEEYSPEVVAAENNAQRLLFFYASWCPQCRELDVSIRSTSLPDGIVVYKVDYDSQQKLREKYGVTLQTTVVKIDTSGNKVKAFVAYTEPTFASVQRELLP